MSSHTLVTFFQKYVTIGGFHIASGLSACSSPGALPTTTPTIKTGLLTTATAYLERGDQYSALKDYKAAIGDYSQAVRLKPDFAEAYNNRGLAYALSGKLEMGKAIADYSQAIQLRPTYAYAYNNRGVAYMASGHPTEAMSDFNRAIQLQPVFPQAYSNRGNVYLRLGRIDMAILDFARAGKGFSGYILVPCGAILLGLVLLGRIIRRHIQSIRTTGASS